MKIFIPYPMVNQTLGISVQAMFEKGYKQPSQKHKDQKGRPTRMLRFRQKHQKQSGGQQINKGIKNHLTLP